MVRRVLVLLPFGLGQRRPTIVDELMIDGVGKCPVDGVLPRGALVRNALAVIEWDVPGHRLKQSQGLFQLTSSIFYSMWRYQPGK